MKRSKNFLAFALIFTLGFFGVLSTTGQGSEGYLIEYESLQLPPIIGGTLWGDINRDGQVTSADATALAQYLLNPCREGDCNRINKRAADVNMDGVINVADVTHLARALVGHRVSVGPPLPLTMNYRIIVNSEGDWSERISKARGYVNDVTPAFRNVLNTNLIFHSAFASSDLNMRNGCDFPGIGGICIPPPPHPRPFPRPPGCGDCQLGIGSDCRTYPHHRSAWYFLDVLKASNINTFRFVGFRTCHIFGNHHGETHGLAYIGERDMIVSIARDLNHQIATAHEISHILGAHDGRCVTSQLCVMKGDIHDRWCINCVGDIAFHRR